jgi:hypothetical protein
MTQINNPLQLLKNGLVTYSLDKFLDIDNFLSLKDEFYMLFANNYSQTKDVWNAGGIPDTVDWDYLKSTPLPYRIYHGIKDSDPAIAQLKDKTAIAYYLKLKYGCFSPYKILHLNEYLKPLSDWVSTPIKTWIETLPFQKIDLVSFFYNDHSCPLKYHRDYNYFPIEQGYEETMPETVEDLIWFRFDLTRGFNFYEIDESGNILQVHPVSGYASTFNHYNWHGNTEAHDYSSLTVKVEGKFTEEFKKKIYG